MEILHTSNPETIRFLKDIIGNDCLCVAGSGVSAQNYCTWGELANYSLEKLRKGEGDATLLREIENSNPVDILSAVKSKNQVVYNSCLEEKFGCDTYYSKPISDTCHMLACIPFGSYITTNYDRDLLRAVHWHKGGAEYAVKSRVHPRLSDRKSAVQFIHGGPSEDDPSILDIGSMVVTKDDYDLLYEGAGRDALDLLLRSAFTGSNVLFVGCGLSDAYVDKILPRACAIANALQAARADLDGYKRIALVSDDTPDDRLPDAPMIYVKYPKVNAKYQGLSLLLKELSGVASLKPVCTGGIGARRPSSAFPVPSGGMYQPGSASPNFSGGGRP